MIRFRPCVFFGLLAALAFSAGSALAHDTWFSLHSRGQAGVFTLKLGTGNRFPVQEHPVGVEHLKLRGCRQGRRDVRLEALRTEETALLVRTHGTSNGEPVSCWAQTVPFDIELPSAKVQAYLKEINAPQAVRAAWAGMQARGVPWKERYAKHARIELGPRMAGREISMPHAEPTGMDLDVLLEGEGGEGGMQAIRVGDMLGFQVLRDGQPLPDFAVELHGDRQPLGLWLKTDSQGRARVRAPLPGRWILRGTDLRLSENEPDAWESRFVTLAFEVTGASGP